LLASSAGRLEGLLPSTDEHLRHAIPLKGALSFSGDPRRLAWLGQATAPLDPVERVTASAEWSSPLVVNIEFTYAQAPPGDAPARVTAMLRDLLEPAEAERLTHAVGPPGVQVAGSRLIVTTRWDHAGLERLAERLGASLRPH
jgi:hypothetical protein